MLLSFGSWKGWAIKTLEELKTELTQELLELERLTGIWPSTIEKRHDIAQAIGRLCYLAEEDLSPLKSAGKIGTTANKDRNAKRRRLLKKGAGIAEERGEK